MLIIVHKIIIFSIVKELYLQLRSIVYSQNQSAVFVQKIEFKGLAIINFIDFKYNRYNSNI